MFKSKKKTSSDISKYYTFELEKVVTPEEAVSIKYSFAYQGNESFHKRCVSVAKKAELTINLYSDLGFFTQRNVAYIKPVFFRTGDTFLPFYEFLNGTRSMDFVKPDVALDFEKSSIIEINKWLEVQWKDFKKIKEISNLK